MEIKDFLLLMWRRAHVLTAGLILGAMLAFVVSKVQTPVYEATTDVLISRARQQTNTDMLPLDENQLVSTNIRLAKNRTVLDAASSQLGSKIIVDNIQVNAIPNTQIIQIKARDQDSQRAAAIANTLVQVLIQQNENLISGRYESFESSLNTQIDRTQKQIDELQTQIGQISDTSISEQLMQVNQEISQLKSQISSLENEINGYPVNLNEIQRASLSEKQARLEQLRPLLNLYQQIQINLTFIGKPGQSGLTRDDPRLSGLQSILNLYQQIYLRLVNSRETISLDRMQNTPNISQMNLALPPKGPVHPLPLLYTLLGSVIGLFVSTTIILMADHFDESLKTISQTEELLHMPVLGVVSNSYDAKEGLVTLHDPSSIEVEAFRSLCVSVDFTSPKKSVHTLLVINADPGKKTTIAANLGVVNAQLGRRVILLDGDLKHPHLHSLLEIGNQAGLANIIENGADIKSVSHSVDGVEGMTLISSGAITENLIGWRSGEKWQELLIKLQKQADLVIVDGPSVETADTQSLASKSDAVLLAIKLGETSADSAKTALRRFQVVGARVAGIVLYRAPEYRTIHSKISHWVRVNKKGGSGKAGNNLDGKTIPLS